MTAEEFGQYLIDSSLKQATYEHEKRLKEEKRRPKYWLTKIWYNGRRIVSLLFQKCRKSEKAF